MSAECNCEPPCPEGTSFADFYFGSGLGIPVITLEGETVLPFREGPAVYAVARGNRYRIVSKHGYWNNSICEVVRERRLLPAESASSRQSAAEDTA